jgi:subtilisin family serine protease
MNSRKLAVLLTAVALLANHTAWAAIQPELSATAEAAAPAVLPRVFATPASAGSTLDTRLRKLDSGLNQIRTMVSTLDPSTAMTQLHVMNPGARFRTSAPHALPEVMIDAVADQDVAALRSALEAMGLESASTFSNDVGGWLPVDQIESMAALPQLRLARLSRPRTRTGAITSQGDFAQGSASVRALGTGFDGTGVNVGVLSDSFNCYATYQKNGMPASGFTGYAQNGFNVNAAGDIATGDLPSTVNVVSEASCEDYGAPDLLPFTDEGRAILQIVHDVAPGASLSFYAAPDSEADFANGIIALAKAGAKVIDDDIGYADEPFFQDGLISQAIDQVEAGGVAYFSSAGNDGRNSYENHAPSFPVVAVSGTTNAGEKLLNFDPSGKTVTTVLPVTIPVLSPGEYIYFTLEWDQPYITGAPGSPGSANALDLCVTNSAGTIESCSSPNAVGSDPVDYLAFGNPANSGGNSAVTQVGIEIGLASGAVPGQVKLLVLDDGAGATINEFQTNSPTLQGHPGAAGAAAVGAAFFVDTPGCGVSPAQLESFSSAAGTPILFDTSGNRLATPIVRNKPDFVATDGVNDTFLGYPLTQQPRTSVAQCANNANYPNFFGTSAAAPHVAAAAALFLQANPSLTPSQIYSAFSSTAQPMTSATGYSYDSGAGFVQVEAAYNSLKLTPPAGTTTGSTTGSTTGATTGSTTGGSTTGVTSAPSGGGGGGAFDAFALGWLCLAVLMSWYFRWRSPRLVAARALQQSRS